MARLVWHDTGERFYETGVRQTVLYPMAGDGRYPQGIVWNGVTGITESPSGAEPTPLYADDIKYLNLMSVEEYGATITAYTFPDEFKECDGTRSIAPGVYIGQQARRPFGLAYRTVLGNEVDGDDHGYKLHIIYGATASPSEKAYQTINDTPEAIEFSWEVTTVPVNVTGQKPTASVSIDSTKVSKEALEALEDILYGTETLEARLPFPDELATIMAAVG